MKLEKTKLFSAIISIGLTVSLIFFFSGSAAAVSCYSSSDCASQQQQVKQQQAQAQAQANQKAAQAAQMKTQLSVISGQISASQTALDQTNSSIGQTQSSIDSLTAQIADQENQLSTEKDKLNSVVAGWYMEGNPSFFQTLIGSNSLSDLVSQQEYYDSIKTQVTTTMASITDLKNQLSAQKSDQQNKMAQLKSLQQQQSDYTQSIVSQKNLQTQVLNMTLSEQEQYLALVAQYQTQIDQLQIQINKLRSTSRWGTQIVSGSVWWYYTQTGNYTRLGPSPFTVDLYGCLITSVAMVATYYGHNITPTSIATTYGSFNTAGYLQSLSPAIGVTVGSSQPVNWSTVDSQISAGHPVIISVYLPTVGAINSDGSSHFVVVYGRSGSTYLMADPIGSGRGYDLSQVRSMKIVYPN